MTLPIERARSGRPVTWLTLLGVLLLPVLIGAVLVGALYNPDERLSNLSGAIVNLDEPVELDGQTVPLGRQLSAGLVEGSDDVESNLTWTITSEDDAAEGLESGSYDAVITIPDNFSAAATSTQSDDPERATIDVATSPEGRVVDEAISTQIATAAASSLGDELSSVYLENVFLGFTTLGEQLGDAADGAGDLADGAGTATDGARDLSSGIGELATGAGEVATGTTGIASGARELAGGAGGLAQGAQGLSGGLSQLQGGASELASGADQLAAGTSELATGIGTVAESARAAADGLDQIATGVESSPEIPQEIIDGVDGLATGSQAVSEYVDTASSELAALAADCAAQGGSEELCASVSQLAAGAEQVAPVAGQIADGTGELAGQVSQLAEAAPQIASAVRGAAEGVSALAGGVEDLASGATELSGGMSDLSGGADELVSGAAELSAGSGELASGANDLAGGLNTLASGADQLAGGAGTLASGATDASDGAETLADGVGELADGTGQLADGLTEATDSIPSYTDAEAQTLASIVADPVGANGTSNALFGSSAIPLLATLALWFGALGSFIALQARPRAALTSRRSSVALAARAFLPAAVIGAAQGVLVAAVVQLAADYTWSQWLSFAALAALTGVVFAAVNQALVALLGGIGRWVAVLVGVLFVATGIVSTIPAVFAGIASALPTAPAFQAMLASLTTAGGLGASLAGLLAWGALSFVATIIAITRARSTSAQSLVARPAG